VLRVSPPRRLNETRWRPNQSLSTAALEYEIEVMRIAKVVYPRDFDAGSRWPFANNIEVEVVLSSEPLKDGLHSLFEQITDHLSEFVPGSYCHLLSLAP
jgi:hypothetical protein